MFWILHIWIPVLFFCWSWSSNVRMATDTVKVHPVYHNFSKHRIYNGQTHGRQQGRVRTEKEDRWCEKYYNHRLPSLLIPPSPCPAPVSSLRPSSCFFFTLTILVEGRETFFLYKAWPKGRSLFCEEKSPSNTKQSKRRDRWLDSMELLSLL